MRHGGLHPDVITFSTLISAGAEGQHWQRAVGLLDEVRHGGLQPDVITFQPDVIT